MLEELQNQLDRLAEKQNSTGLPEFEAYSPKEMHLILYKPFTDGSPISLKKLTDEDYLQIPMMKQILYLANIIKDAGELKLTQKGYLPTKVVADICSQKFLPVNRNWLEPNVYKESDSPDTQLAKFLLDLSGIIKKRNNKLSLTKSGEKLLQNYEKLFQKIFTVFGTKLNWAYFDGYEDNGTGQIGYVFTLILLSKYGSKKLHDKFYSDKYFDAFPNLYLDYPFNPYREPITINNDCYSIRSFERFLWYFGLIDFEQEKWDAEKFVWKTELFDRLISVRKPKRVN